MKLLVEKCLTLSLSNPFAKPQREFLFNIFWNFYLNLLLILHLFILRETFISAVFVGVKINDKNPRSCFSINLFS